MKSEGQQLSIEILPRVIVPYLRVSALVHIRVFPQLSLLLLRMPTPVNNI
jgi:hypothetical protein